MEQPGTAGILRRIAAIGYDSLLVFSLLFGATGLYHLIASALSRMLSSSTLSGSTLSSSALSSSALQEGSTAAAVGNGSVVQQIEPLASTSGPLFTAYLLVVMGSFFIFFWCRSGQTLGMQAWRLRIDSLDGGRISTGQAVIRLLTAGLSALCFGLGYLWPIIDRDQRSWQDISSKSRVVLLPKRQ